MYSESGVMAVQITRRERAEDARRPAGSPSDYLAYFGRYEVDTENQLVRHLLEGQIQPGRHPDTLERTYRFYDDKLSLKPLEGTDREILWQRT
jgi:catechol 1,2-dioxygenase